jgi:pimeloyl-ACP methyl ester carboxylesterase
MDKADLGDRVIEYDTHGVGEPVILIHGSGFADEFVPLMNERALASRYRLVRYHRRGYMGTTHSPPPVRIVDQARDCLGLIRHLGISRAHIVGHSYGGAIAIKVALEEPAKVHSLSLLEPALLGLVPSGANFGPAIAPAMAKYHSGDGIGALEILLKLLCGADSRAELEHVLPGALKQAGVDAATCFDIEMPALAEFCTGFSSEEAARIQQPLLGIVGTASQPPFQEGHKLVRSWFNQAEPFEIAGANHLLPITRPSEVADALVHFLASHPLAR